MGWGVGMGGGEEVEWPSSIFYFLFCFLPLRISFVDLFQYGFLRSICVYIDTSAYLLQFFCIKEKTDRQTSR